MAQGRNVDAECCHVDFGGVLCDDVLDGRLAVGDLGMKTVIEMAREAGLVGGPVYARGLERFAELVRADEREACASIADSMDPLQDGAIAFVIRARGNK